VQVALNEAARPAGPKPGRVGFCVELGRVVAKNTTSPFQSVHVSKLPGEK
jgi:hypothetical protein